MKPENELQKILNELKIEPDEAREIKNDIESADRIWNRMDNGQVPDGLFTRIESEMVHKLTRRRIAHIRLFRMVAAAACLIVILGAVLYQLNLAGQKNQSPKVETIVQNPPEKPEVVVDDNLHYELKYWQESRQNIYNNMTRPAAIEEKKPEQPPQNEVELKKDESVGVVICNSIA